MLSVDLACTTPSTSAREEIAAIRGRDGQDNRENVDDRVAQLEGRDLTVLMALLDRPHAQVRTALGDHRIHCDVAFAVTPAGYRPERDGFAPPRRADSPILEDQRYRDDMTLRWQGQSQRPAFHFVQRDASPRAAAAAAAGDAPPASLSGHEVVQLNDKLYTRSIGRPWYVRDLEDDHQESWLDQAYGCVRDVLQVAGTALTIRAVETRDAVVTVELGLNETSDARALPGDRYAKLAGWRQQGAKVRNLTGRIEFDRTKQTWQRADFEVALTVERAPGGPLQAQITAHAQIEPLAPTPAITAPADAVPWPERQRYSVQANQLLDGLAPRR